MTSSHTRTALRYIGDLAWRTALLVLVVALAAFLCNQPAPAAAAPASPPAHEVRSGDVLTLTAQDCALIGLTSAGNGACQVDYDDERYEVVAIAAPDNDQPEHPAVALLLEEGYGGMPDDAISAVYAPVGTWLYDETGSWTVTVWGLARCEHLAERTCTGLELYT